MDLMKHEAIRNLYSNVVTITEEKDVLVALDENNNEVSIDMDAVNIKATELQADKDAEIKAKEDLKISGKQKLKDLGLDDDEIQALIGV